MASAGELAWFPAIIPEPEAEHPVQRLGPNPAAFLVEGCAEQVLLLLLDSGYAVGGAEWQLSLVFTGSLRLAFFQRATSGIARAKLKLLFTVNQRRRAFPLPIAELAGKHTPQNELRGIVHNGPRRKIAELFHYGVNGLIAGGKQLLAQTMPCFQSPGDGLVFLDVGNRHTRHNGDRAGTMQKRLKRGAEVLVFLVSICVLPAPEVVDFSRDMPKIRRDAFFGEKLDWLRVSIKKSLQESKAALLRIG